MQVPYSHAMLQKLWGTQASFVQSGHWHIPGPGGAPPEGGWEAGEEAEEGMREGAAGWVQDWLPHAFPQ